MSQKSSLNSRS